MPTRKSYEHLSSVTLHGFRDRRCAGTLHYRNRASLENSRFSLLLTGRSGHFARNVSSGEERGETGVFAGYNRAEITVFMCEHKPPFQRKNYLI